MVNIPGRTVYRADRRRNGVTRRKTGGGVGLGLGLLLTLTLTTGGGVACYLATRLAPYASIEESGTKVTSDYEMLSINLDIPNHRKT